MNYLKARSVVYMFERKPVNKILTAIENGSRTQRLIMDETGISQSHVSRLCGEMAEAGLIQDIGFSGTIYEVNHKRINQIKKSISIINGH